MTEDKEEDKEQLQIATYKIDPIQVMPYPQ